MKNLNDEVYPATCEGKTIENFKYFLTGTALNL